MNIKMYFVNLLVKALLVEILCLIIIDANGMFLYISGLHDFLYLTFSCCIFLITIFCVFYSNIFCQHLFLMQDFLQLFRRKSIKIKKCPYSEFFWSECGEIRTRNTPNTDTFHACYILQYEKIRVIVTRFFCPQKCIRFKTLLTMVAHLQQNSANYFYMLKNMNYRCLVNDFFIFSK